MAATAKRGVRKVRTGVVTSDKMDKTVVVAVTDRFRHPIYGKTVTRTKKFHAHDEKNEAHVGDKVRIVETRPISRLKHWRLLEVVTKSARGDQV
ncbi:MAG TPA: 30S ribosomal protein S17 [Kiritimatiellia bacterium]|mgnify:CR=1 FL=1|nr:30S ribosomal protein S17 [Kiritimatiellia bacterium]HMO98831.1 30S ribosomal protein S17 [Kiritimatiellia bacterium]HMP96221.1 30S ribosomal protein S17 [Kiritimatiellia bacterium]